MKSVIFIFALLALATTSKLSSAIVIPGADGSDGSLVITQNTEIDLSLASIGTWNQNNTANAGKGVYDPQKWAVVFKYESVTIDKGATLTFKNNKTRAPVVWLVTGEVRINGNVRLDGKNGVTAPPPNLAEPGPGGFRGGMSNFSQGVTPAAGFGPSGGFIALNGNYGEGSTAYGNASMMALVGGSGGGGANRADAGGGAGGGAILIACANSVIVNGLLSASGGEGVGSLWADQRSGSGSGGGIRIVSNTLSGVGIVKAVGGGNAGVGRIRVENVSADNLNIAPDPSLTRLLENSSAQIWPSNDGPDAKILSIGGVSAPVDPSSGLGIQGADVMLPLQLGTTQVLIETRNVEQTATVRVRRSPRSGGNTVTANAVVEEIISETPLVIRWKAALPVLAGYSAVQVHVVNP